MKSNAITIGWRDSVPMGTPIEPKDLLKTQAIEKATRHLAVEVGGREARSQAWRLARLISRLAVMAPREGVALEIHTTNQTTAPAPWDRWHGLGVEVRGIADRQVVWDIALYSGGRKNLWRFTGCAEFRTSSRADVLLRRIKRGH